MGGVAGSAMVLQVRRTHLRGICYHANLKGFAQSELWLLLVMCAAGSGRAVAIRVCLTATVKWSMLKSIEMSWSAARPHPGFWHHCKWPRQIQRHEHALQDRLFTHCLYGCCYNTQLQLSRWQLNIPTTTTLKTGPITAFELARL